MSSFIPKGASRCSNTYIINVTPDQAKTWLSINNFNRPRRPDLVAKYVKQIKEGRWKLTHQGLAFTVHGTLLDGQHRLFAVVESGVTVPFRVVVNESSENFAVIDCGKTRTHLDVVRMGKKDNTITTAHTQTLKSMLAGRGCRTANRWSNEELNELYHLHTNAVNYTVDQFRKCKDKQINDPTVRGVVARAHYHVHSNSLDTFCSLLLHGGTHPSRNAVFAFVRCLHAWEDRRESTKQQIYHNCEAALEAFLANAQRVEFGKSIPELFPLAKEVN